LSYAIALLVSFVAGVISLSYEILWYRVYAIASGSSPTTFGFLLGFYLLGLAFGSYVSIRLCDGGTARGIRGRSGPWLRSSFCQCGRLPRDSARGMARDGRLVEVGPSTRRGGGCAPGFDPSSPQPFRRRARRPRGSGLSGLYFANILGSVFGSLATGFVLLEVWPLRRIAVVLALAGIALALALALVGRRPEKGIGRACLAAAGAALCVVGASPLFFDDLYARLLYKEGFRAAKPLAEVVENRHDVVVVTADKKVYGEVFTTE